jgi:hypothetical protein
VWHRVTVGLHPLSYFETVLFSVAIFICKLFRKVIYWRRRHIGKWELKGKMLQRKKREGMTDLVIKGGDLIGDRYHPRELRL